MLKLRLFTLLLTAAVCGAVIAGPDPGSDPGSDRGPREQLRSSIEAVIATVKDTGLDQAARRARIREIIDRRFDFRTMSRGALSVHWRKVSAEQRTRFVDKFSDLVQNSYIGRIEAYTDERVAYRDARIDDGRAEIDTVIVTGGADIPIRYKLRKRGRDWLVYDVVIEEVSLIRNYRSSYRSIVKREGFDGLMARMDEKLAQLTGE